MSEFRIGPRGNRESTFDMSFRCKSGEVIRFTYRGQEELDYTLWTEDSVLVFEAKQFAGPYGFDIGWHKLAFPCYRFKGYKDLKVIPVYYLRIADVIYLFVFNKIVYDGNSSSVPLNGIESFRPAMTFKVILPHTRLSR